MSLQCFKTKYMNLWRGFYKLQLQYETNSNKHYNDKKKKEDN